MSLGHALQDNASLSFLDLGGNDIGDGGAAALGEVLKVNTSLTSRNLQSNGIGDEGVSSILKVLTECNTTLTELVVWDDDISEAVKFAADAFVNANRDGMRLLHATGNLDLTSRLAIDGNSNGHATRVAMELEDNRTVTALVLNKNRLGDEGSTHIAKALIKNRVLASIELNDNSISTAGCLAVATALRENRVLSNILLNGNLIGPDGARALAEALKMNPSLQNLGLGRNSAGNDGAVAIADALRSNTTLQRLDLDDNFISDTGAAAILSTLQHYNHTLTSVNLVNNSEISPTLQGDSLQGYQSDTALLQMVENALISRLIRSERSRMSTS
jgi:Ran GTPase-activating protein (RanGAP) involved in mRNA processing and transport